MWSFLQAQRCAVLLACSRLDGKTISKISARKGFYLRLDFFEGTLRDESNHFLVLSMIFW